jgi:hypothetical protein
LEAAAGAAYLLQLQEQQTQVAVVAVAKELMVAMVVQELS